MQQESSSPHFAAQASPARHPAILLLTYISPLQRWGSAKRSRFLIDALKQHGVVDVLVLSFVDIADARPTLTVTEMDGVQVMELQLVQRGSIGAAGAYAVASLVLCLLAAALSYALGTLILRPTTCWSVATCDRP